MGSGLLRVSEYPVKGPGVCTDDFLKDESSPRGGNLGVRTIPKERDGVTVDVSFESEPSVTVNVSPRR